MKKVGVGVFGVSIAVIVTPFVLFVIGIFSVFGSLVLEILGGNADLKNVKWFFDNSFITLPYAGWAIGLLVFFWLMGLVIEKARGHFKSVH